MRDHEIKALMGYLDRIADALECIAGTGDHAPQRMASPQRLHAQTVMAKGISDLPDLAGYYYPEPPCDVVHFNRTGAICVRPAGHMGFHRDATEAVVWYDPDAGKDRLYEKMAENDEPERCGSLWDVEPLITCIRDEGHAGPHREVGGNSWGNYKDTPECDATLKPLGEGRLIYCSRERGHAGDHHGMSWTWSPDSAIADDDPEQECADVSEARRHQ